MKYYIDRNDTPLAFHAFIKWVSLPLGILRTLAELMMLSLRDGPEWATNLDGIMMVADLVLLVVALVGFIRWAGFGWKAWMVHLGLAIGYVLLWVGLYALHAPYAMGEAVGNLLAQSIYCGLVGLYYMKRRYLFYPEEVPALLDQTLVEEPPAAPVGEEKPPIAYCRHCGDRLLPDSAFCSGCGARVGEEGLK